MKEWALGYVNSPPAAGGSQEAGFMQPKAHSFAQSCISLCLQTKKGKNSLQVAAMSEVMTEWLLDLKTSGLVTDQEVHLAAPKGTVECQTNVM